MKKIITTICFVMAALLSLPAQNPCSQTTKLTGGQKITSNGRRDLYGSGDTKIGYEMWTEGGNNNSMIFYGQNVGGGCAFRAEWNRPNDFLGRVGYSWNSSKKYTQYPDIYCEFNYTRSGNNTAGDYSYIGIYGWSVKPQEVEYYIVEDWFGNQWQSETTPVGSGTIGVAEKTSVTIDGSVYKIYTKQRTGPSISGNSTFTQVFSVRQNQRKCGTISITEHFKAWEKAGVSLGNLYECEFLCEAGGGTGWFEATHIKFSQGARVEGNVLNTTASPAVGGTITRSPDKEGYNNNEAVQLTAKPAEGWTFDGWTGDASGTGANTSVTMNANKNIVANFKPIGVSSFNILEDGNFPANSIGSSWQLNTGENYGNSAATSSISGGKATVNVTRIGAEAYQPQLIQKDVSLDKGMKYRLTFTASAASARSMSVVIQKATAEYDNYASTDFELTTTPQTYTFEFEMKNESDPAAQFAFNLGAVATSVTLSEVKLVHIAELEPEVKVTLTFDPNGGTLQGANSISVEQGAAIGTLPVPTREGYSFEGWVDSNNVKYTADTKLTADVTVAASWKAIKDLSGLLEEVSNLQKQIDTLTSETDNLKQLLDECE